MTRTGWMMVAGVCAAGLVLGVVARPFVFPRGRIALHPASVQLKEGHIEGAPLEVHFELANESRQSATVKSIGTSCGCMALTGKDGPLVVPFSLEPGATVPITLSIGTAARIGSQTFALAIAAEGPHGSALEARAEVRVNLLGTLRSNERMVIFRDVTPGTPLSAEIQLADMLPDPGVEIREVRTSNEGNLRVELKPTSGPSDIFGESVAANARATLKVTYTPDATEGRIQEMITIVPDDSRYPVVQIPVFCEMAEPPLRLRPRGLSLSAAAGNAFRRTVVVESQEPIASVSVVACPRGVEVEIEDSGDRQRTLTVKGDASQFAGDRAEIRLVVDGKELSFPIRVLP